MNALLSVIIFAAVQQPNGTVIPTNVVECAGGKTGGLGAVFACACTTPNTCNIGAACPGGSTSCDDGKRGTCEMTLWHEVNDDPCIPTHKSGLDPVADASIMPETFRPTCPLTFTLQSRANALFQNSFGWYNVAAPDELHVMIDCRAKSGDVVVLDLKNDPAYKGGDIGFFLLTPESHAQKKSCDGGDCCATVDRWRNGAGYVYRSQRTLNPDGAVIHLLTYDSKVSARKFYFAWEDLFGGSDNNFTDLVTSVQGVDCGGAGESCNTGMAGACAVGVSVCRSGSVSCQPIATSQPEMCDGVDNDCNGKIDDGARCDGDKVCAGGACVGHCSQAIEFPCVGGTVCDEASGLCIDPNAAPKTCDNVVCPHGQECFGGACVDLCAHVSCAMGEVCVRGVCVAGCNRCDGLVCGTGQKCDDASGRCVEAGCATACAAGTFCKNGNCVDACEGARCPEGESCRAGVCASSADPPGVTGSRSMPKPRGQGGCQCDFSTGAPPALPLFLIFALAWLRRRR